MLHRRWSPKVALPVGPLWGKSGEGGVAGCMTWGYQTPRDSSIQPKRTALKTRAPALADRSLPPFPAHEYTEVPDVKFEPRLEENYTSRTAGSLQVRPPTATYVDPEKKYFYTSTAGNVVDYTATRDTRSAHTPFYEDAVIAAVRDYTKYESSPDVMVGETMTGARPPKPPSTKQRGRNPQHRGRRVEFKDEQRTVRSHTATPTRGYVPKVTGRSNDALGKWQNTVDDILLDRADHEYLIDSYTRPGSVTRYRSEYYDPMYDELTTPVPTPPPPSNRNNHSRNDLDPEHKWLMSKYRRSAKAKVDSHWEKDHPVRMVRSRSDSRVNVNLDCPEETDMTVNVSVHNNNKWRY